ncbi:Asp-tRNA(Asn)/Glu-tRNA(Gln) amidotransferase subunit GatC [Tumebacillus permanentifrigoris]|uniref:Aspartyl/glutamyl-tRNA(Asn/Gln) amidotransferase subunit C n=1 Tax=Tumebacillus permanentifrigoris TaxID=378543 RepID=A0A316DCA6_9BACL|nr:Asp-tRNA(Asn)/Glu-tRNA(Gln) amidotransferase subunit GatC [Tumebacillus permanentifrigoris]PWK14813.1 aspartyl/glutamyl-tRNA(Asn/Gln) amidotransferase subunit C [Tumebacillus permanentifrigoris]
MSITVKDVEHIANLSRLILSDEQKVKMADSLGKILNFANELQELDVENVAPTTHSMPLKNVLREDEASTWLTQHEALSHAPDQESGQFKVPAVMEG